MAVELQDSSGIAAQEVCSELGRFVCNNGECIRPKFRCDGQKNCKDRSDEKNYTQDECNSNFGLFLCNNGDCIPYDYKCDGEDNCDDRSDEWACSNLITPAQTTTSGQLTTSEQFTTPTQSILETGSTDTEFAHPTDTSSELSAYALYAIPDFLAVGVGSYALCAYASYKAIKQAAPTLPTGQALSRSWHPLSFRQTQQQLAAVSS
ncbi:LDL receptor domain-containing protein [Endozoicomonas acroporae]|uniref:LDL receptor domain-containing protein n=1 Tax=Endozoicomonas acroporae TaxID=1701104 RepID=UPI003F8A9092